jgi:chloride channel 3/4/5
VEGPGRRVGYDDLTAIDWIFEYTKERQRKRLLYSNAPGLAGYARRLLEASNVWVVLIATGVLVGIIAACIDITSDWLGDLKTGYCKNGPGGGKFYLNRSFCCWGHDGKVFVLSSARLQLTRHINQTYLSAWIGHPGVKLLEFVPPAEVIR